MCDALTHNLISSLKREGEACFVCVVIVALNGATLPRFKNERCYEWAWAGGGRKKIFFNSLQSAREPRFQEDGMLLTLSLRTTAATPTLHTHSIFYSCIYIFPNWFSCYGGFYSKPFPLFVNIREMVVVVYNLEGFKLKNRPRRFYFPKTHFSQYLFVALYRSSKLILRIV